MTPSNSGGLPSRSGSEPSESADESAPGVIGNSYRNTSQSPPQRTGAVAPTSRPCCRLNHRKAGGGTRPFTPETGHPPSLQNRLLRVSATEGGKRHSAPDALLHVLTCASFGNCYQKSLICWELARFTWVSKVAILDSDRDFKNLSLGALNLSRRDTASTKLISCPI